MMLRTLVFGILITFISSSASAQAVPVPVLLKKWNALTEQNKDAADTARVNLLNSIAASYYQLDPDSSLLFSAKAIAMAVKIRYSVGETRGLANFSKTQYIKGNYTESLKASIRALAISKKNKDLEGQANAYNGIGLIYMSQDKIVSALEHFEMASKLNIRLKNTFRLAANYVNIGICYDQINQLERAISALIRCVAISNPNKHYKMVAMAKNRLGDIYFKKKQYMQAITYHNEVLESTNFQDDWENSFAYSGLANAYYQQGNYEQAVTAGKKGLLLAQRLNTKWDIDRSLKILSTSYAAINNYKEAYKYLSLHKLYSDSLLNESKENEINGMHLKQQQVENRELVKKNQINQQQISINKMVIVIIALIAISLIVISTIVYWSSLKVYKLNKSLQKNAEDIAVQKDQITTQNMELSELNRTKDQLFSVIGHDLRGPFASILGMQELIRSNDLSTEEIGYLFNKFFDKITVTTAMLDNLLVWANSQQSGIIARPVPMELSAYIDQVLNVLNFLAAEKKISIIHTREPDTLIYADPDHIRIIFQNIISNAIKFTGEQGSIQIFYKARPTDVTIHVKDNGVGMSPLKRQQLFRVAGKDISSYGTQNEKGIGIGLMLVKKFVDENAACTKNKLNDSPTVESVENVKSVRNVEHIKNAEPMENMERTDHIEPLKPQSPLSISSEEGLGTEFIITFKRPD